MLVLSRKLNQSIHIGDGISIRVVRIKGNSIQLGIDAPKEIHVVRSELLQRDACQPASADLLAALRVISQTPRKASAARSSAQILLDPLKHTAESTV